MPKFPIRYLAKIAALGGVLPGFIPRKSLPCKMVKQAASRDRENGSMEYGIFSSALR